MKNKIEFCIWCNERKHFNDMQIYEWGESISESMWHLTNVDSLCEVMTFPKAYSKMQETIYIPCCSLERTVNEVAAEGFFLIIWMVLCHMSDAIET